MPEGGPHFTVIVPTYQRRDLVCEALRALDAISYEGEVDVIVVVDGSTDGTAEAIRQVPFRWPLTVVEQKNTGLSGARNRGAEVARGEFLLFLDDDMICHPDILDEHAKTLRNGIAASMGDIPLDPASPPGMLSECVGAWASTRSARLAAASRIGLGDLLCGQIAIRREVFEEIGGFDTGFTAGGSYGNEDLDLGVRLLDRHTVTFCPNAVSFQRYIVTPRQNLRNCRDAGMADVRFAGKHPERAEELFAAHRPSRRWVRCFLRPMARLPGMATALSLAAVPLANHAYGWWRPLDRLVIRIFEQVREVSYWAGVEQGIRDGAKAP